MDGAWPVTAREVHHAINIFGWGLRLRLPRQAASETIAAMQLLSKESLYKSLILMGQVVLLKVRSPRSRRPPLLLQRLRRDCSSW